MIVYNSGPIKVDQIFSFSNFGFFDINFDPEFGNPSFDTPDIWVRKRALKSWV